MIDLKDVHTTACCKLAHKDEHLLQSPRAIPFQSPCTHNPTHPRWPCLFVQTPTAHLDTPR
jgi:hypothetical protein